MYLVIDFFLLFHLFTFYPGFPVPPPCLWEGAPYRPLTYPPLYQITLSLGCQFFLTPKPVLTAPRETALASPEAPSATLREVEAAPD